MNSHQKVKLLEDIYQILIKDHPEFQEEGTTGNDLLTALQCLMIDTMYEAMLKDGNIMVEEIWS